MQESHNVSRVKLTTHRQWGMGGGSSIAAEVNHCMGLILVFSAYQRLTVAWYVTSRGGTSTKGDSSVESNADRWMLPHIDQCRWIVIHNVRTCCACFCYRSKVWNQWRCRLAGMHTMDCRCQTLYSQEHPLSKIMKWISAWNPSTEYPSHIVPSLLWTKIERCSP